MDIKELVMQSAEYPQRFLSDGELGKLSDFIKEQELEHVYRVDQSTYQRFRDLFSFNGIPQYIVLDKAGNVVDADFAMHSFDFELPKILKKYK